MGNEEKRVSAEALLAFARDVLAALGLPDADAEIGAECLVWANLRGVDSHGVGRLPWIAALAAEGDLNPRPEIRILRETPAVALIDGDRGLGAVTATFAMRHSLGKAESAGIGWSLLTNTVTPLAIGFYTEQAAARGMIGIAATYGGLNTVPYGARAAGLHNGPISIAVPAGRHRPPLLDMATSVAAQGKLEVAQARGASIPEGWALDGDGKPTTDPDHWSMLLPLGTYKGSGLSFMLECLTSILAGDPQLGPMLLGKPRDPRHRQNALMAALDIGLFTDTAEFRSNVDDLIEGVKHLPTAEGVTEILVPGEPEDRARAERERAGIPLPERTLEGLRDLARRLGLDMPGD
jgi:LDH2 family malate/lactate/ureidoglycolate dehydrogenase